MPAVQTSLRDLVPVAGPDARLVSGAVETGVDDVTHDSRDAAPGVLFACRPGARADGHDFAPVAVTAGSPALLVERVLDLDVPQLVARSVAQALGPVAAAVHRWPARQMTLCGITGTAGKTTVAYLLEAIFRASGHTTGLIGTVQTLVAGHPVAGVRTTPESSDLQRLLHRMVAAGVTATAMEVSSHGLALGRVRGTRFAGVAFTNLSQDHLDFHLDLEDYFRSKAMLFTPVYSGTGVINIDDAYGRRLAEETDIEVVRLSPRGTGPADVLATDVRVRPDGVAFTAHLRGATVPVSCPLPGRFNVANTLTALALAEVVGVDAAAAAAGVADCRGVPGRMERVDVGQPFTVLVDYAHKPGALQAVLVAARDLATREGPGADGKVAVVVGCGGERDAGKRPVMGQVAAEFADLAVVTSDNPRGEDPQAIVAAIAAGAKAVPDARVVVEVDRRAAIAVALRAAGPGDVVVVAGKGHEAVQELAGETIPFDDRLVVRELLTREASA